MISHRLGLPLRQSSRLVLMALLALAAGAGVATAAEPEHLTLYGAQHPQMLDILVKGFKAETDGEETVGDKPAAKLKITGPEGKTFTLSFDKATGLPAKLTATVRGFSGEEVKQETVFDDYKEIDGIKKATKVESKRDGQKYMTLTVTSFKVLDKVDPKTFAEPD